MSAHDEVNRKHNPYLGDQTITETLRQMQRTPALRDLVKHTMVVERVEFGGFNHKHQPSTIALLHGRLAISGQAVTAACEPDMARAIAAAIEAESPESIAQCGHGHVLATPDAWSFVGRN